jgi:phage-related minor tail protein
MSDTSNLVQGTPDLAAMDTLLKDMRKSSDAMGRSLTGAFSRGIVEGRKLEDVLKSVGQSLAASALKSALKPVETGISSLFSSGFQSLFSAFTPSGAAAAPVQPFADGGVIATPTYFPMGRSMGLMGERGAEAIMPLSRGPDGKLGVRGGGGGGGRPISVQVNITTPDADSFRRSEAQVSAALARATARGQRAI